MMDFDAFDTWIFDLDGTLLDTLDDLKNSVNFALRAFDMPERSTKEIRSFVGNGVRLLVERAVPEGTKDGVTIKVFEAFREHYLAHSLDHTKPYPGVVDLLRRLHGKGKKIAIVSNKLQAGVDELNRRFFSDYVSVAVGEKTGVPHKPAPDMVFAALDALTAKNAVYVGDSEVDLQTAKNAGLPCICVLWGFRDEEFLRGRGAEIFIREAAEIVLKS